MNLKPEDLAVTESAFNDFIYKQVEMVKLELKDKPKGINPHLAIESVGLDGKHSLTICCIATDFNTHEEKKHILMGIGRKTYAEKMLPVMVSLYSEAWMAHNPPPGLAPSKCEDRKEVVIIMGMDFSKTHGKSISIPVNRDAEDRMEVAEEQLPEMGGKKEHDVRFPLLDHFFRGYAMAIVEEDNQRGEKWS